MRRNPAPPYPNANLSPSELRKLRKRWAAFGERWLRKVKAKMAGEPSTNDTVFQSTLDAVEFWIKKLRVGDDPPWSKVLPIITALRLGLRTLETHAYGNQRGLAEAKRKARDRIEEVLSVSDLNRLKSLSYTNKAFWSTAYKNNKLRFMRLVDKILRSDRTAIHSPVVSAEQLLAAGIPVRDLAPWHDDPKKFLAQARAAGTSKDWTTEYDVLSWMHDIGLDEQDGPLRGAISRLATAGGTFRRPSRQEAYRLKNQLEEERKKSEDDTKGPAIQKWLDASERYRKQESIDLDLPPGWHQVTDAAEVLRRSRADGLCLDDTLAGSKFGEDEDQDGDLSTDALAFIVAQDKGRTVVGLNKNGVVRNHHHCTGKDNKFDKEAWNIFSDPPTTKRNPPSGYRVKLRRGRRLLHVVIR